MTREEAIFELKKAIANNTIEDMNEAYSYMISLDMAIKALEQPCREQDDYENEIEDLHNRLDIAEYDKERLREEVTRLEEKIKALEQEPKTDYKSFAEWVASEIFSEDWEINKNSFEEIACRKLNKLGIVASEGDTWKLNESEVSG